MMALCASMAAEGTPCHVLFVGGSQPAPGVIQSSRGQPVLTVTDGVGEADARGIINFVVESSRVRFQVDLRAAAANGIQISSKLLALATSVRSGQ